MCTEHEFINCMTGSGQNWGQVGSAAGCVWQTTLQQICCNKWARWHSADQARAPRWAMHSINLDV